MFHPFRNRLAETHGGAFELLRHFLAHSFDGETAPTRGEWLRVALTPLIALPSAWMMLMLQYQVKYRMLRLDSTPGVYRAAVRDDQLWLIAVSMCLMAILVALKWQSLFPTRRDMLALASLPVTGADIFRAKSAAVLILFSGFAFVLNVPASIVFTRIASGPWQEHASTLAMAAALAVSASAACALVFFTLIAAQGILLNMLPERVFTRVSVYTQAILFAVPLGALPFLSRQHTGSFWWPPQWFVDLWAAMIGARDGSVRPSLLALSAAAAIALLTCVLSYRRHMRLLVEMPSKPRRAWSGLALGKLPCRIFDLWIRDPREQALFAFVAKAMARSRTHRLVLLAYAGLATGWLMKVIADTQSPHTGASHLVRLLVVFGPLSLAIFITLGLRHLFCLPVELRANWIFQMTERDGRGFWLRAVERFVIWCGILPVFAAALPVAAAAFGWWRALAALALCLTLALLAFEALFLSWRKAPFTCSHVPDQRPMVAVLLPYLAALSLLPVVSVLFLHCSAGAASFLAVLAPLAAGWLRLRSLRKKQWAERELIFEDGEEPAVTTLDLGARAPAITTEGGSHAAAPLLSTLDRFHRPRALVWLDELRQERWLEPLWQDFRYGFRLIRRNPALSGMVVATLTLGIGINASVFTVLKAFAARLRVHAPATFARIILEDRSQRRARPASSAEYDAYRTVRSLTHLAAWSRAEVTLGGGNHPASAALVSCNFFDVDGLERARLGRLLLPEDCAVPGQAHAAVLSEGIWRARFGADPRLIGQGIRIDGLAFTVVGIAPVRTAGWAKQAAVWLPYTAEPQLESGRDIFRSGEPWLSLAGRLAPGFSRQQAKAEFTLAAARLDRQHPGRRTAIAFTDGSWIQEPDLPARTLWFLGLVVVAPSLMLLVSCANVATLLLSRAASRRREIAVRLSLGAPRIRIVRMLLTECLLLAAAAGVASLCLAWWAPGALFEFIAKRPADFPLTPDWRILTYLAVAAVVAACLSGLAPALESLKSGLTESLRARKRFLGSGLVSVQVALSLVLLTSAGLFARAQFKVFGADPGYETRKVLVVPLRSASGVASKLESLPGVRSVAYAGSLPLIGHQTHDITLSGGQARHAVDLNSASPGYFNTLGISILRGREFRESDAGSPAVIVSESFARKFWGAADPVGTRLELAQGSLEVIGVAKDVNRLSFGGSENPVAYWMGQPNRGRTYLLVRFEGNARAAANAVKRALPDLAEVPKPLQSYIDDAASILWNVLALILILGAAAAALAISGIYGAVSFHVNRRTRDLGIRVALGAQKWDITRDVFVSGGKPVVYGLLAGLWLSLAAAAALDRTLRDAPFRPDTEDPFVYAGAVLLLASAAIAAMWRPARRAAAADPVAALRADLE